MGELWLLRHGQTEWTISGQHTGKTDISLTLQGEEEARSIAGLVGQQNFSLALVSPAERARQTAILVGQEQAVAEPQLWEWDYGAYEGLTTPQIRESRPGWDIWNDGVIPGETPGETLNEFAARADAVLARVDGVVASDENALLISHGHMSRMLIARWLGLAPVDAGKFVVETATVSILGFERERRVLHALNRRSEQ